MKNAVYELSEMAKRFVKLIFYGFRGDIKFAGDFFYRHAFIPAVLKDQTTFFREGFHFGFYKL